MEGMQRARYEGKGVELPCPPPGTTLSQSPGALPTEGEAPEAGLRGEGHQHTPSSDCF